MAKLTEGQSAGTPAGADEPTGQDSTSNSPVGEDLIGDVVKAAKAQDAADQKAKDEKAEGKSEGKPDDSKEKPAPYDQDPKWKAARASQAKLDGLLEKHGLDSAEELEEMLNSGMSISEILGARDAKTLTQTIQDLKKAAEWKKEVEAYWAQQKEQKDREELTPEERAEMSEKQLREYKAEQQQKATQAKEDQEIKAALDGYSNQVDKIIESIGLSDESAEVAKLFLGVNNPFNEVDITDKKAVREMAKTSAAQFKTFVDKIRQGAIDEYASGKSKLVPISKTDTSSKEVVTKKPVPKGASVDQVFAQAQDEMLEIIRSMEAS